MLARISALTTRKPWRRKLCRMTNLTKHSSLARSVIGPYLIATWSKHSGKR